MDLLAVKIIKKYIDKITNGKENTSNKVTSLSASSTDIQYPSAKAVYDELNEKALKNSPALTGTPTAPTATYGTNTNQIATTAFVQQSIRPTLIVTVNDIPSEMNITVTATLIGSNPEYSVTEILNSSGIASLGLDYTGEYSISFNDPHIKGHPTINITLPKVFSFGAVWTNTVTYTVLIDTTNSNPETACTYADNALGMTKGSSTWDNMPIFKQIRPCVFQNGQVNYYLNPNNWNEKYNTNEASNLTGEDGDVMIEFPKFAYKIKTENSIITVSVSNDENVIENDNDYTYDAFSRLEEGDLDYFYKGAFMGSLDENEKLRSLPGKLPANYKNIRMFREAAQANGAHYQQSTYAQVKALQCLYLIKYGNRNCQAALGKGISNTNTMYVTGYQATAVNDISSENSNLASGMNFGNSSSGNAHVRLFGIEDLWGNLWEFVDGLTVDANFNIIISQNNFSNEDISSVDETSIASGFSKSTYGYTKEVIGNSITGFFPIDMSGSSSTYWSSQGYINSSCILLIGGKYNVLDKASIFTLRAYDREGTSTDSYGARLSYI